MYADDTHLTYASNNIHNIQTKNVHNWLKENKLTLNMTKTEFMLIGSRQRLSRYCAKSLGVTIDDNLDWGSQMEKIIKKVSSGIWAVKRVRHVILQATLQLIYQALINPHFNYCNTRFGETVD